MQDLAAFFIGDPDCFYEEVEMRQAMLRIRESIIGLYLSCFFMLLGCLAAGSSAHASPPPTDPTFQGITGFEVKIGTGLINWINSGEQILERAKAQLRKDGVTVLSEAERLSLPASAQLVIDIDTICTTENKKMFIQVLKLELKQAAVLLRNSDLKIQATTWSSTASAKFQKGEDEKIEELVDKLMKGFVSFYMMDTAK